MDFHRAIYRLSGNPAIEEMIAPHWPHMRRSMATVLAELDYRNLAWHEHETIAAHVLSGNARAAEASCTGADAQSAGRMTEAKAADAGQGGVTRHSGARRSANPELVGSASAAFRVCAKRRIPE